MQKLQGFTEQGNTTLTITGAAGTISRKVQGSFPGCTVTVYKSDTLNLATIYDDNVLTPKANPFTASTDGTWYFYVADGKYDVKFSGGGITTPFTIGDILASDASEGVWANVKSYGAKADIRTVVDGGITALDTTFTSATAAFTAADVVKTIVITGAGVAGVDYSTTIASVTNATTVEVVGAASTTVVGASTVIATNDSPFITLAIAAVATKGGVVYFPPGTYSIEAPIVVKEGVHLKGVASSDFPNVAATAKGSVLRLQDLANCDLVQFPDESNYNCSIQDMYLEGNKAKQTLTNLYGIKMLGSPNNYFSRIHNVMVVNISGTGIYINRNEVVLSGQVYARLCSGRGIHVFSSTDVKWDKVYASYNGSDGVYLEYSGVIAYYINTYANWHSGLVLNRCGDCVIYYVEADTNGRNGIRFDSTVNGYLCRNNRIYDAFVGCNSREVDNGYANVLFTNAAGAYNYENYLIGCRFWSDVIDMDTSDFPTGLGGVGRYPSYLLEDTRTAYVGYGGYELHLRDCKFASASPGGSVNTKHFTTGMVFPTTFLRYADSIGNWDDYTTSPIDLRSSYTLTIPAGATYTIPATSIRGTLLEITANNSGVDMVLLTLGEPANIPDGTRLTIVNNTASLVAFPHVANVQHITDVDWTTDRGVVLSQYQSVTFIYDINRWVQHRERGIYMGEGHYFSIAAGMTYTIQPSWKVMYCLASHADDVSCSFNNDTDGAPDIYPVFTLGQVVDGFTIRIVNLQAFRLLFAHDAAVTKIRNPQGKDIILNQYDWVEYTYIWDTVSALGDWICTGLGSTRVGNFLPQYTTVQIAALAAPTLQTGLFVYDTTANKLKFYNGGGWETVTSA